MMKDRYFRIFLRRNSGLFSILLIINALSLEFILSVGAVSFCLTDIGYGLSFRNIFCNFVSL